MNITTLAATNGEGGGGFPSPDEGGPPARRGPSNIAGGNNQSSSLSSEKTLLQKKRFLLFIKILFKSLEESADSETRDQAKEIVADCTRRNRLGDPAYSPLTDAVDRRLRGLVGESYWQRAHAFMLFYLRRREEEGNGRMMHQRRQGGAALSVSTLSPTQRAEV